MTTRHRSRQSLETVTTIQQCLPFWTSLLSPVLFSLVLVLLLFQAQIYGASAVDTDTDFAKRLAEHRDMFQIVDRIQVLGPSVFPKPTRHAALHEAVQPFLKPYFGQHRPDQDAVFAFASEYGLSNYMCFVQSLRETGFDGDIVLVISQLDVQNARVWSYLSQVPGIVIYVPKLACFNYEGEQVASAKGGMRTCQCHELYGHIDPSSSSNKEWVALPDPRPPRTIATTRYEIYWIMLQNYSPHSWILLVDARDTFFQDNPFVYVPRQTDPSGQSGLLYFFGENIEATRLGKSKSNQKWLSTAYGDVVSDALADKPTICSGATLGEQVALEAYTRALVAEADDTGTVLMGADQGFHNFLYYSGKLQAAQAIHDIVVFDQGTGLVNNMGALRSKPLEEWGNGQILAQTPHENKGQTRRYQVLNWDGTLVPVVHQFDRHKVLQEYFVKQVTEQEFIPKWRESKHATE